MLSGAAGPLQRRDPVQVPAFVAEESDTRDQPRTLVLGGASAAKVSYTLVRGSGSRLGDAELAEAGGSDGRLDKVVANLVAGSGADQTSQLSGFAIRYVLVRDGAPRQTSRVLDATPGLSRLSQLDGSALWRVDRQVARATIVTGKTDPLPVAADPVEAHAKIAAGTSGRVLRIADSADEGWQATLDGRVLPKTTVDGWAQGFELPAEGGRLDLTYDAPATHTAWIWIQGALALVLLVLALPGRRREIDDDLPEEEIVVPAQPVEGEGRRARRLRAQAEAESETEVGTAEQGQGYADPDQDLYARPAAQQPEQQPTQYAAVPQQQYGEWDAQSYADNGYTTPYNSEQYQGGAQYGAEQYGDGQQYSDGQQYGAADQYQQQPYQADPYHAATYGDGQYQEGQYDPYGQQGGQPYADGSETEQHPGNTSRGESE